MPRGKRTRISKAPEEKALHNLSQIIKDLASYAVEHPEVVKTTRRILDASKGAQNVSHIPVMDIIKILDEVIIHRHRGSWSSTITKSEFAIDNAIITLDLTIHDDEGHFTRRPGIGACNIYARGQRLSTDAIDNATKIAMSNALKKAAGYSELGITMWDREHEPEPIVIDDKTKLPSGGGKIVEKIQTTSTIVSNGSKDKKLPDELATKLRTVQEQYGLTNQDVINILADSTGTQISGGNTAWLLDGNQTEKVDLLIAAIHASMK